MIMGVRLDGIQRSQSPVALHLIEPRPLPDGTSYGATIEEQSGLHLVRISRVDGSPLNAATGGDFKVERLRVPATDGSAFTLAWVLSSPTPPPSSAVALGAVLTIAAIAAAVGCGSSPSGRTPASTSPSAPITSPNAFTIAIAATVSPRPETAAA
jgi:hypothetical protein